MSWRKATFPGDWLQPRPKRTSLGVASDAARVISPAPPQQSSSWWHRLVLPCLPLLPFDGIGGGRFLSAFMLWNVSFARWFDLPFHTYCDVGWPYGEDLRFPVFGSEKKKCLGHSWLAEHKVLTRQMKATSQSADAKKPWQKLRFGREKTPTRPLARIAHQRIPSRPHGRPLKCVSASAVKSWIFRARRSVLPGRSVEDVEE